MPEGIIITNHTELHHRIMHLNYLRAEQELAVKRNIRELMYSIHPSMIFKNIVNKFSDDTESTQSLKTMGLNIGKDFLINKLFGKGNSIKGFISSLLVRKATDFIAKKYPHFIENGIYKVENFVSNFTKKSEK